MIMEKNAVVHGEYLTTSFKLPFLDNQPVTMDSSEVAEFLHDWEHIQSPIFHMSPAIHSQELERVEADGGLSVFPPDSHEGLQIPCPPPPPPDSQSPGQPNVEDEEKESSLSDSRSFGKLLRPRFEILRSGVAWIASRICYYAICGHGLWPLASMAAVTAAVFYWRVRRRRYWVREERDSHLELLIRKKDQRINQLLLQIAQMKEMLLARRKVTVVRIG
uniref:Transmembrane protein n=1 Tax=Rhizophora mucronata TaxID=61149 RepID=A0A2P2JYM9_RHIMU